MKTVAGVILVAGLLLTNAQAIAKKVTQTVEVSGAMPDGATFSSISINSDGTYTANMDDGFGFTAAPGSPMEAYLAAVVDQYGG